MPKIALVDDEQSILTSVSLSLQSEGFTVDTFLNGVEALEALESKSYDLGLFDIKMPKMDGNELLSKVRSSKIENLKDLPIIFLTSKDHEQDEIIGLKMGASDYIKKPFSQKLLNERIKTVLRIHNNRTEEQKDNNIKKQNFIKGDLILDEHKQLCFWKDIEIFNDENGKPFIKLHNNALKLINKNFNFPCNIELTLSDEKNYSIATVIIFKNEK